MIRLWDEIPRGAVWYGSQGPQHLLRDGDGSWCTSAAVGSQSAARTPFLKTLRLNLQTHEPATMRFQRTPRKFVPSNLALLDSAARNGVVDIPYLTAHTLNKLSDRLPAWLVQPCRSCGGYPKHHVWCPTLGLNVLTAVHEKEDGRCSANQTGALVTP
jgi:hypothetical protein